MVELKLLPENIIETLKEEIATHGFENFSYKKCRGMFKMLFDNHLVAELDFQTVRKPFADEESVIIFFDNISNVDFDGWSKIISKNKIHQNNILNGKFAYISELKVSNQLRGLGIGSQLLKAFESSFNPKNIKHIYLVSGVLYEEVIEPHSFYLKNNYTSLGDFNQQDSLCKVMYKAL